MLYLTLFYPIKDITTMRSLSTLFMAISCIIFLAGCTANVEESKKKGDEEYNDLLGELDEMTGGSASSDVMKKNGITLTPVLDSPKYPDATLKLNSLQDGLVKETGRVPFDFDVSNYALGSQTADADQKQCANSAKGQHIHVILGNQPYSAHYTEDFVKELDQGHYVMLAFLSRSYHESIKTKNAHVVHQFTVGNDRPIKLKLDQPMIFYSRPKGTYLGAENIKKVMLDFYPINCTIGENKHKVLATINGTEFLLDKWVPYMMEGLPEGENEVRIELINPDGSKSRPPFNNVARKFTLAKDEPIK